MDRNSFIYHIRRGLCFLINLFKDTPLKPSKDDSIDVIIPVIRKDLAILPLTIEGVRKNVNHPVTAVYIVAPAEEEIKQFCRMHDLVFVDEKSVLGYNPQNIHFVTKEGVNRGGWIFQQLLKLSGNIGTNRRFLVIDADHVLLKPHTFITDQHKYVFYHSDDCHLQYYKTIKALTGKTQYSILSYISHKMIFDKVLLNQLKKSLEAYNGVPWDQAIISSIDDSDYSPFSEYELYGLYVPSDQKVHRTWKQKGLKYEDIDTFRHLSENKAYSRYWSLTFPSYVN
jgi:hypothetical protein